MKLVSIIVPVYNVEKYIEKCLSSIQNQSYKNLEIIIVNDGSPDNSQKIIDQFLKIDDRFICINKENGGLSSARNAGIEKATGDYLAFIDSDDWIDEKMIEDLVKTAIENDAQIAICDLSTDWESGENKTTLKQGTAYPDVIDTKEFADAYTSLSCFACNKLFETQLFKVNNIHFPLGLLFEDIATFPRLFFRSKRIAFLRKAPYHYIVRAGAITQTFKLKGLDYLKVTQLVSDDINQFQRNQFRAFEKDFLINHNFFSLSINCGYLAKSEDRKQAFDTIKEYYKEKNITWKDIKKAGYQNRTFWQDRSQAQRMYYRLFWFGFPILNLALSMFHKFKGK